MARTPTTLLPHRARLAAFLEHPRGPRNLSVLLVTAAGAFAVTVCVLRAAYGWAIPIFSALVLLQHVLQNGWPRWMLRPTDAPGHAPRDK